MQNHLTPERLEAFVEQTLDEAESAVFASHLATCARCEQEVSELRVLFESLASLPAHAPSAGFQERVMRRVRVPRPMLQRVNEWVDRVTPATTRGWALAAGAVTAPTLVITAAVWWVLSHPAVGAWELWAIASTQASAAAQVGWQWALSSFAGSAAATWLTAALELAVSLGRGGLGLAAAMFATMTVVSTYVLYDNLFRPKARRAQHASYSS
jgi:anti-sigma factor RsiW